jgi:hypothetical protein
VQESSLHYVPYGGEAVGTRSHRDFQNFYSNFYLLIITRIVTSNCKLYKFIQFYYIFNKFYQFPHFCTFNSILSLQTVRFFSEFYGRLFSAFLKLTF